MTTPSQKRTPWVILEITQRGEDEARAGGLAEKIAGVSGIGVEDIFVPILRVRNRPPKFLIEGYIFIRAGHPASKYLDASRSPYVRGLLSQYDTRSGMISKNCLRDEDLRSMVEKAKSLGGKFQSGDEVEIVQGYLKGLDGVVVCELEQEQGREAGNLAYCVEISLKSVQLIVTLDSFSIEGRN